MQTFKHAPLHIWCVYHVDAKWREQIGPHMRQRETDAEVCLLIDPFKSKSKPRVLASVREQLRDIRHELNPQEAQAKVTKLRDYLVQRDTNFQTCQRIEKEHKLSDYLEDFYLSEACIHKWQYCDRFGSGANSNMISENFFRVC